MMVDGRRLLRAGVIGLLLALLLGSGSGFALAMAEDAPRAAMARPSPGAHAVYGLDEFHLAPTDGELRGASLELTWMPEKWVPDGRLDLRLVHPLVTRFVLGDLDLVYETDYDAATGEPVLSSGRGEYYGGGDGSSWSAAGGIGLYGSRTEQRFWSDRFGGPGGVCGMRTALQDGQDPKEPLLVRGDCDYVDGQANLTYEYVGKRTVSGERAHVFREAERPYLQLAAVEDKPFPLRVTAALSDMIYSGFLGHERMYTLRLEEYRPGEGSYTWPEESLVQPGPGLPALVPRAPHLVDTSGYPFPFSLDDAYAAAVRSADPDTSLAPFLQAHPSAYVAEAYTQEMVDSNGATHYAWLFIVTDGGAWTGRAVEEGPRKAASELWLPEASGRALAVRNWVPEDGGERDWANHYLPSDRLPERLPSAADLLARHRFVENRDIPGARYLGWRLTCKTPSCIQGELWMGAGYEAERFTPSSVPVLLPSGHGVDVAILSVGLDGKPLGRWAYTSDRPAFTVTGSQHTADGDFTLATSAVSAAPAWVAPGPVAATGLGLLGLLASALYYFWPHVKGLALAPLFSRIADDEVLDNPNRARILDLVRTQPGIHFQDLVRQAGVGRGTLEHHLRKLEAAGLVTIRRAKGYACCFPKGAVDRRLMDAAPVLRSEGGRAVLREVAKRPGASSRDLATELGFAPSTVSYHLKRLESAGLVSPDPAVGARLTPLGEQAKA